MVNMEERLALAHLHEETVRLKLGRCFVGFDGFTDEILRAVATRSSASQFTLMQSMHDMSARIQESRGKSCNIELVSERVKIGGQGPIFSQALSEMGHQITLVGLLGDPDIEPLFESLRNPIELISLGPSSQTLAIEFSDGKVMLGKHHSVHDVSWETLLRHVTCAQLIALHETVDLFMSGNWTMLPGTTGIWKGFINHIIPHLSDRKRWMYIDLADPAKRSDSDLREALDLLKDLMPRYQVILGLNLAESRRVGSVYGVPFSEKPQRVVTLAEQLVRSLEIAQVVIHAIDYAVAADGRCCELVWGPDAPPLLTTGGGDNFNAGYCHALLNKLSLRQALLCGVAVSGFYISHARSPRIDELASFFRLWHSHPNGLSTAVPL